MNFCLGFILEAILFGVWLNGLAGWYHVQELCV